MASFGISPSSSSRLTHSLKSFSTIAISLHFLLAPQLSGVKTQQPCGSPAEPVRSPRRGRVMSIHPGPTRTGPEPKRHVTADCRHRHADILALLAGRINTGRTIAGPTRKVLHSLRKLDTDTACGLLLVVNVQLTRIVYSINARMSNRPTWGSVFVRRTGGPFHCARQASTLHTSALTALYNLELRAQERAFVSRTPIEKPRGRF